MKAKLITIVSVTLGALILIFSACRKKQLYIGDPPSLSFKTGGNYSSANDTVVAGDTVLIGLQADANGSVDKLSKFVIRRSINNVPVETLKEIEMTEAQQEKFSGDYRFILMTPGTQVYTFIIMNTHGLQSEKTITFTVSQ